MSLVELLMFQQVQADKSQGLSRFILEERKEKRHRHYKGRKKGPKSSTCVGTTKDTIESDTIPKVTKDTSEGA